MTEKQDELEILTRRGRVVQAGGENITVTTVKVRRVPELMAALRQFGGVTVSAETTILPLLETHAPAIAAAVAAAVDRPLVWVEELPAHELLELAEAALEVNADFFFTTVLPRLAAGLQGGGRRFNGSSPGATGARSSSSTP